MAEVQVTVSNILDYLLVVILFINNLIPFLCIYFTPNFGYIQFCFVKKRAKNRTYDVSAFAKSTLFKT